jgi:acetyltransferase
VNSDLGSLLNPRSVVVVGASDRPQSVGAKVARNLLQGGYTGQIWLVNARHDCVAGQPAFRTIDQLPQAPDLAVICTPAATVPGLITELGARGCRAAVIITAGLDALGPDGRSHAVATCAAARVTGLRLLGPNCVGLLSPGIGLNASFAHRAATPGPLAFIAQSGALTTALLDWACTRDIGFSHFISLGNALDVGFPDLLAHLATDSATQAILLYIESVADGPRFLAAATEAARNKPVLVIKSGRAPEGARAAASHTGALAGADELYDAAFRRAGVLRVDTLRQLFSVAETLARCRPIRGDRLAIVTNGGGPAILATDAFSAGGGHLAALSGSTFGSLDAFLPSIWSHGDPVDIAGDASPARYAESLRLTLADPQVDAVLLIHAPTAIVPAEQIAAACVPVIAATDRAVLTCWVGGGAVDAARQHCMDAGLPVFDTPEEAIDGFLLARHQTLLRQALRLQPDRPLPFSADLCRALRAQVAPVLAQGRPWLTEPEAKAVLALAGIPVVQTVTVRTAREAVAAANQLGWPVVLKILSPDITHKSDVGGVALNLADAAALQSAVGAMEQAVRRQCPQARIDGFSVQRMVDRSTAHELILGLATDATFGRFALFGSGGKAVEVLADKAVELLPLEPSLAAALIARTRVSRLLAGYRDQPPANLAAIQDCLLRLSLLAEALPELCELDINPLLADEQGVIALDARIRLCPLPSTSDA